MIMKRQFLSFAWLLSSFHLGFIAYKEYHKSCYFPLPWTCFLFTIWGILGWFLASLTLWKQFCEGTKASWSLMMANYWFAGCIIFSFESEATNYFAVTGFILVIAWTTWALYSFVAILDTVTEWETQSHLHETEYTTIV